MTVQNVTVNYSFDWHHIPTTCIEPERNDNNSEWCGMDKEDERRLRRMSFYDKHYDELKFCTWSVQGICVIARILVPFLFLKCFDDGNKRLRCIESIFSIHLVKQSIIRFIFVWYPMVSFTTDLSFSLSFEELSKKRMAFCRSCSESIVFHMFWPDINSTCDWRRAHI